MVLSASPHLLVPFLQSRHALPVRGEIAQTLPAAGDGGKEGRRPAGADGGFDVVLEELRRKNLLKAVERGDLAACVELNTELARMLNEGIER